MGVLYLYKYNIMDIMASMVSTYCLSQFVDMPLFTVCMDVSIQRLTSEFSIQTDEVPVLCIDVL
jgi:hypothetical protein